MTLGTFIFVSLCSFIISSYSYLLVLRFYFLGEFAFVHCKTANIYVFFIYFFIAFFLIVFIYCMLKQLSFDTILLFVC